MAKVWKRKDRDVWVVDYRDAAGRRVREAVSGDRNAALKVLAERIKEVEHAPANLEDRDITVQMYAERWLEAEKSHLEAKTHHSYEQLLKLHIFPAVGKVKVRELRRKAVRALLNEKCKAGYSKNTVRLIRAALSTVLSEAVEDEIITSNPILGMFRKQRHGEQTATPDVNPMAWEQLRAFERAIDTMIEDGVLHVRYAMLFTLMVKTGLRPGEALALKPGDVDVHRRKLKVERALTLNGRIKPTKTAETRMVDLSLWLAERLREYLLWLETESLERGGSEWLFPGDAWGVLDERQTRKVFYRILKRAELPEFRVYDLRHTFASLLLSAGVPLLYVSKQLGHTKPTTTLKYYAKWIPSGEQSYVETLDSPPSSEVGTKSWHQVNITGEGSAEGIDNNGGPCRDRTYGPLIKSQLLYQLS